jgi:hypothetical protein
MTTTQMKQRAVVTSWSFTAMVAAGFAWLFGFETSWWQRALAALPVVALGVMDHRDVAAVVDARLGIIQALTELGWLQAPLAVAGGAWLAGLNADAAARITLVVVIVLVASLLRYSPSIPAPVAGPAGGEPR